MHLIARRWPRRSLCRTAWRRTVNEDHAILQGTGYANPRRAGLAPLDTAEQAVPDRPAHGADARCALVHLQLGVLAARGGARRAAVGSSLPWPLAGLPSFPSFITDPATVAAGDWPSRRAGPCPRRRLRAAPTAALVSLTASPRRPGFSRAMNSGKTAATATSPSHCAEPTEANTGLRILESGWCGKPQESRACRHRHLEPIPSFFPFFTFNVPTRDRSFQYEHRYPS